MQFIEFNCVRRRKAEMGACVRTAAERRTMAYIDTGVGRGRTSYTVAGTVESTETLHIAYARTSKCLFICL